MYSWQQSSNGSTWTNIPLANSSSLALSDINESTYYRRVVTSGGNVGYSNIVRFIAPDIITGPEAADVLYSVPYPPGPTYPTDYSCWISSIDFNPDHITRCRQTNAFIIEFKENTLQDTLVGYITIIISESMRDIDGYAWYNDTEHKIKYAILPNIPVQAESVVHSVYRIEGGGGEVQKIMYFDGLQRLEQSLAVGVSPSGGDIVSFAEYDNMGRDDVKKYLPFVAIGNNGTRIPDPKSLQRDFYQDKYGTPDGSYAYSKKNYNADGTVLSESGPGANYNSDSPNGHPTYFECRLNTSADAIRKMKVIGDSPDLWFSGNYGANKLVVKRTYSGGATDNPDDDLDAYEYINSEGQVIAKEVRVSESDRRITYYVYDELGRQRYVIPPIQTLSQSWSVPMTLDKLTNYCYYTEYDKYGRPVKQYIPGAGYTQTLYDKRGRIAMTQSAAQRAAGKWSFTKYDDWDRPVVSGIYTGGTYDEHWLALNGQSVFGESRGAAVHGYSNDCYPVIADTNTVLTISYYDDYRWSGKFGFNATHLASVDDYDASPAGAVTGTKTKVLGIDTHQWLVSTPYYDAKGRMIQTIQDLYGGGQETVSNISNFAGEVTQTRVSQTLNGQTYSYDKWFVYDNFGRLKRIEQQIAGDTQNGRVTLASYDLDEFGGVASKSIHNNIEKTTYSQNISGQRLSETSPTFSYSLAYDQTETGIAPARYDGSLAYVKWNYGSGTNASTTKAYLYTYDKLGQMTSASYREKSGNWAATTKYREGGVVSTGNPDGLIQYDKNGNISSMLRTNASGATMHQIGYTYAGNQLSKVSLGGVMQSSANIYDADGNLTKDVAAGIEISYNAINLPERVFAGAEDIKYIYSADGMKLASVVGSSLTLYRSVMTFTGNSLSTLQPQQMMTQEGTIALEGSSWVYKYFKKDHVGSTRMVLAAVKSGNTTILREDQRTDYYAFGLPFAVNNLHLNRYLFSGKELQDVKIGNTANLYNSVGGYYANMLSLFDFGARYYNPVLGRWFNVDPALQLANPYLYCGNSPGMYIDPDGEFFFLGAIILGGWLNAMLTEHMAWKTGAPPAKPWQGPLSFAIGALAGAAGELAGLAGGAIFGAGGGFFSGFIADGMRGFAGGFTGGTGNAWMHGADFGGGLGAGIKAGAVAAAISGTIGGVRRGIEAYYGAGANFWTGRVELDISEGVGAIGPMPPSNVTKLLARYAGRFEDANVYESRMMGTSQNTGGLTLPPKGILVAPGVMKDLTGWNLQIMQHEYGHWIQAKLIGNPAFYTFIGAESLALATADTFNRTNIQSNFWGEKWANFLADTHFGSSSVMGGNFAIQNIPFEYFMEITGSGLYRPAGILLNSKYLFGGRLICIR